jgi:acyl-CoA synthetase (AMP-forming)/AMP-acid ligase II
MPSHPTTDSPDWTFADVLRHEPHRQAFVCAGKSATREELLIASERAAAHLSGLGLKRGDVLALWLPDGGTWLQLLFGAARIGVLVVPISTRYRLHEARHVILTARARAIALTPGFLGFDYLSAAKEIQQQLPHLEHILEIAAPEGLYDAPPQRAPLNRACSSGAPGIGVPGIGAPGLGALGSEISDSGTTGLRASGSGTSGSGSPGLSLTGAVEKTDALCTFSTSGTTGHPKLAVHDQWGIARHGENVARTMDIRPGDVMLCALSLYGVLGFVQAISALAAGASCVFMQVYKAEAAADAIEQHGVTHFFGADGLFAPVLAVPGRSLASWRCGGFAEFAGLGTAVIERAEKEWNLPLVAIYGSSECFAMTGAERATDPAALRVVPGGYPTASDIAFRVVDVDSGKPLADGERGELQFRGFNVMTGYLNNPVATAGAFTEDGWFRSGDLGYAAGPRFVYLSRLKDGLRLRGYLVDPTEIEEFLARHSAIVDAQVVGVNRVGEGDLAVAFVRASQADLGEADLLAYCKSGIANYKVPSRIVFVSDYPRADGPNGTKILKNKLREMAEQTIG